MACTLRFVGRDSGGVKNLLYITDTTSTGMVGYIITLNGNTVYSDGITAPHAAGSTISLSAPNTDGVIANGTYHVYQRIIGETVYENDFVLNYTVPANTLSLTIDGYSSTVVCRDSTLYTGLTISNYLLTHSQPTVGDTTSLTTPFTIPSTIYAGTHTLSLVADILWTGTLVTLEDRLTYSTTDTAYLLDENTVMNAVDNYKASYRLNLVNNKSEARNQRAVIAEIDLYEDDYWIALRRNDKLTAYRSLLVIYDLLKETLVATGEIPVYQSFQEQIVSVSDDLSSHINAVSSSHSISQITGLQTALTNLSIVTTDSSLTGDGTESNPLAHNPADTTITGLKSNAGTGGEVSATLYNWFKSVYASLVDSSVKSWIIGLVTFVKSLADRVTTLENDIINYSISVPEDVSAVDVTGLNAPKGSTIILAIDFVYSVNTPASTYNMLFNDITTGYRNGGLSTNNNIVIYSPLTDGSQYISTIYVSDFIIVNGLSLRKATGSNPVQLLLASSLLGFSDSSLTKITIKTTESGKVLAAGTKINLKVIR